jgi:hypothetical protein
MAHLETLSSKTGQYAGRGLIAAFKLIARNFAKVEPKVVDSGAADYIPTLADINQTVLRSRATAQTVTLPQNSAIAFPIGSKIDFVVTGAGTLTVQAGAGATVTKRALDTLTALTLSRVTATKVSTNGWSVSGGLTLA